MVSFARGIVAYTLNTSNETLIRDGVYVVIEGQKMDAIKINLKKPTKTQKLKQAICQHEKLGTFTQTDIYWHVNGTMCADCQKVFKLNIRARTEKIYS